MTGNQIRLYKAMIYFEAIGSWKMAEIFRKWLREELVIVESPKRKAA